MDKIVKINCFKCGYVNYVSKIDLDELKSWNEKCVCWHCDSELVINEFIFEEK